MDSRSAAGHQAPMRLPVDRHEHLPEVATIADLLRGPGDRILRRPARQIAMPRAAAAIADVPHQVGFENIAHGDLYIARLDGIAYVPKRTFVNRRAGTVAIASFRRPFEAPAEIDVPDLPADLPLVPGVTYAMDTHHFGYGHMLLEAVSQMWALRLLKPDRVIMHRRLFERHRPLLAAITDRPLATLREPALLETAILVSPAYVLDASITAEFVRLCTGIREHFDPGGVGEDLLYVSRSAIDKRRLENEPAVEALFAARGFRIFHPETAPVAEQVRAFSRARVIAGPVGSALYNTVFSRPGTRRLILAPRAFRTANDMLLSAFTGAPPLYVVGDTVATHRAEAMVTPWTIDLDHVRAGLAAMGLG